MTPRRPVNPIGPDEVVEFVVHGALAPRVIDWLNSQGIDVIDFPGEEGGLRCLMTAPGDDLMQRAGFPARSFPLEDS